MRSRASSGAWSRIASRDLPMLKQLAFVGARRTPRRRAKRPFDRAADRRADRHQKLVAARLEDRHVEIEIGANAVLCPVFAPGHPLVRFGDPVEGRLRGGRGRQRGGGRLDHLPQRKKVFEPNPTRRGLEPPSEHFRIQGAPCVRRAHASSCPRASLDESFGDQDAVGFPQSRARDREFRAHFRGVRQQRTRRTSTRHNVAADSLRQTHIELLAVRLGRSDARSAAAVSALLTRLSVVDRAS